MADYTPTTGSVRSGDAREEEAWESLRAELGHWLARHDAELRAEVERLREVSAAQPYETERELAVALDEARRELADLRAGIEALADTKPGATGRALRALLAGSGEQPGEDVTCSRCQTCGRDQRAGWCKHPAPAVPDVVRELDAVMHHHADRADAAEAEADRLAALLDVAQEDLAAAEAPVVPDSADVREDGDGLLPIEQSLASALWARWADRGGIPCVTIQEDPRTVARALRPWLLAVVGQGVTGERTITLPRPVVPHGPVGQAENEATANYLWEAARRIGDSRMFGSNLTRTVSDLLAAASHAVREDKPVDDGRPAAVRPSGQEGS